MPAHNSVFTSTLLTALLLGLGETGAIAQPAPPETLVAQSSPFQSINQSINNPYSGAIEQTPGGDSAAAGYTLIHVNPSVGRNATGDGSQRRPFQTITHALRSAEPNSIVLLAPGVYSIATGEMFPLLLKPGVTVQGNLAGGDRPVVIQGGGFFRSLSVGEQRNATILAADGAGLANVIVNNPTPGGNGLWIEASSPVIRENQFIGSRNVGIVVVGNGAPIIQGNYFNQNRLAGLMITGSSQAEVSENLFQATGVGVSVAEGATPRIVGNRIVHNQDGLVIYGDARPELAANQISQNRRNRLVEFGAPAGDMAINAGGEQASNQNTSNQNAGAAAPTTVFRESPSSSPSNSPAQPAPSTEDAVLELNPIDIETAPSGNGEAAEEPSVVVNDSQPAAADEIAIEEADAEAETAAIAEEAESLETDAGETDAGETDAGEAANSAEAESAGAEATPVDGKLVLPVQILPSTSSPEVSPVEVSPPAPEPTLPTPPTNAETADTADEKSDLSRFSNLLTRLGVTHLMSPPSSQPTATSTQPDAIEIPVIGPPSHSPEHPQSIGSAMSETGDPAGSTVIEIPVIAPPISDVNLSSLPEIPGDRAAMTSSASRLQVPSSEIPIGSSSGLPTISVSRAPADSDAPPEPPSRASTLGLYYRVIVVAEDKATQDEVRSLVPDAFRTRLDGRIVMQVGAYEDQATADEQANRLIRNGLDAEVKFIR
ncbi:MAG: DUF1565 domain-containing protein [Leptolyngbyaceae cyanobacterium MO_188.B28]|nr:DUF1565 domain-containing protein [Leptolyngbyaceae cyanobacterium MO_188.B28]